MLAFYCFGRGLDDDNDYLRIFHGMWHCFGSVAIFYINQSVDRNQKTYGFWKSCKIVYTFSWIYDNNDKGSNHLK